MMKAVTQAARDAPTGHLGQRSNDAAASLACNVRALAVTSDSASVDIVSVLLVRAALLAGVALNEAISIPSFPAFSPNGLVDPAQAIPRHRFTAVLQGLAKESRDPSIGVRLGAAVGFHHLHFIDAFLLSSISLTQALDRFQVVRRNVLGGPAWTLAQSDDCTRFTYRMEMGQPGAGLEAQFFATLLYRIVRALAHPRHLPRIGVDFAVPYFRMTDAVRGMFAGPVSFSCSSNGIVLPTEALDELRPGADASYAQSVGSFVQMTFMNRERPAAFSAMVKQVLHAAEAPLSVELESIARSWRLSARTVRRRLEVENVTFAELRDQVCSERARDLILHGDCTLDSVAAKLGYAGVNAFRRRFKVWFGESPAAMRRKVRPASLGATPDAAASPTPER